MESKRRVCGGSATGRDYLPVGGQRHKLPDSKQVRNFIETTHKGQLVCQKTLVMGLLWCGHQPLKAQENSKLPLIIRLPDCRSENHFVHSEPNEFKPKETDLKLRFEKR